MSPVRSPSLSTFYSGVISLLDLSNPLHICMRALFLVAFFSFLRISNLVPYTLADVRDPKGCYLRLSSVTFTAQGVLLRVTRTKTIQFRQRELDIPLPYIPRSPLDPKKQASHSFRRGGVTFAFACHAPRAFIKAQGDWQSDAYLVYLQFSSADKLKLLNSITSRLSPPILYRPCKRV